MNSKTILTVILVSVLTTVLSMWALGQLQKNPKTNPAFADQSEGKLPANYASFTNRVPGNLVDFSAAASAATPAVVHIKTKIGARNVTSEQRRSPFADLFGDDFFGEFFGGPRNYTIPEQRASGSGVIISKDGYIVTNNHVIDKATEIEVTMPTKHTYKAKLIGADASSDLAVLKIEGDDLPFIIWGNSDQVQLGQWVLAIGYPWTLDITVTAGIVSAKARTLDLNSRRSDTPIESFIQTDAAVNQGNSGGALVDTEGKLIGINSAIASQTGSYAGYSYAIPVNIVRKISNDLIKFGAVQRAFIGIKYIPDAVSDEDYTKSGAVRGQGVYVSEVTPDGAAAAAGIKSGDYITSVNDVQVSSGSEMVEQIANYNPGDKVVIGFTRGGKSQKATVTLKNQSGNYEIVKYDAQVELQTKLGAEFENIAPADAKKLNIDGGVRVRTVGNGVLAAARVQKDFVITSVNNRAVKSVDELMGILSSATGTVRLEGIYPGFEGVYGYPINLK